MKDQKLNPRVPCNPFLPNVSILYPLKTPENPVLESLFNKRLQHSVFWCFQGV